MFDDAINVIQLDGGQNWKLFCNRVYDALKHNIHYFFSFFLLNNRFHNTVICGMQHWTCYTIHTLVQIKFRFRMVYKRRCVPYIQIKTVSFWITDGLHPLTIIPWWPDRMGKKGQGNGMKIDSYGILFGCDDKLDSGVMCNFTKT